MKKALSLFIILYTLAPASVYAFDNIPYPNLISYIFNPPPQDNDEPQEEPEDESFDVAISFVLLAFIANFWGEK